MSAQVESLRVNKSISPEDTLDTPSKSSKYKPEENPFSARLRLWSQQSLAETLQTIKSSHYKKVYYDPKFNRSRIYNHIPIKAVDVINLKTLTLDFSAFEEVELPWKR